MMKKLFVFVTLLVAHGAMKLHALSPSRVPDFCIKNVHNDFGVIPGIDFHPSGKMFAATYLGNYAVLLYSMEKGTPQLRQFLKNPEAQLSLPHGIVFHPSGNFLVVSQYGNHTLTVYTYDPKMKFLSSQPKSVFTFPSHFNVHNSHGLAFSPAGDCLAITFCDCDKRKGYEEKIVLFPFDIQSGTIKAEPFDVVIGTQEAPLGNPKGIVFSPDGRFMIVTMCDSDCLYVYSVDKENYHVNPKPHHIIKNPEAQLARAEDIKFSPDGNYLVVTNTDENMLTVYAFNKSSGKISPSAPVFVFKNPESQLAYPHGISFSPNGKYLAVTHYGIGEHGAPLLKGREDKITFYRWKP
jgi:6-phosphogluconolactonase (cycloisomerase 2 family)